MYHCEILISPPARSVTLRSRFHLVHAQLNSFTLSKDQQKFRGYISFCVSAPFSVKLPLSTPAFLYPKAFQLHFDSRKTPVFMPVLLEVQFGFIPLSHGVWIQLSFSRDSLSPRAFRGKGAVALRIQTRTSKFTNSYFVCWNRAPTRQKCQESWRITYFQNNQEKTPTIPASNAHTP